jgi:hypothetical protein
VRGRLLIDSVITRNGSQWEIVTTITAQSGAVYKLQSSARTKTAALRQKRRHLAQAADKIKESRDA